MAQWFDDNAPPAYDPNMAEPRYYGNPEDNPNPLAQGTSTNYQGTGRDYVPPPPAYPANQDPRGGVMGVGGPPRPPVNPASQTQSSLLAGQGTDPTFGAMPTPWTGTAPTFQAPTAATLSNDGGYQWRLAEGNRGIQRAAAARGSLLSGGTLKALAQYNQNYASNELGSAFGRANTEFTNANTTYQNRYGEYLNTAVAKRQHDTDLWGRLNDVSNRGLTAASYGQNA